MVALKANQRSCGRPGLFDVVQTLNRSGIGNDNLMQTEIVNAIDQGPTIVNYFGHGSVTVWTEPAC